MSVSNTNIAGYENAAYPTVTTVAAMLDVIVTALGDTAAPVAPIGYYVGTWDDETDYTAGEWATSPDDQYLYYALIDVAAGGADPVSNPDWAYPSSAVDLTGELAPLKAEANTGGIGYAPRGSTYRSGSQGPGLFLSDGDGSWYFVSGYVGSGARIAEYDYTYINRRDVRFDQPADASPYEDVQVGGQVSVHGTGDGGILEDDTLVRDGAGDGNVSSTRNAARAGSGTGDAKQGTSARVSGTAVGEASVTNQVQHFTSGIASIIQRANATEAINEITAAIEISEQTAPAAPGSDKARFFARDDGTGKTQYAAIFAAGGVVPIITQPQTSGALPTQTFTSGTGAQVYTTRRVEVHTPVTFNPEVAANATCLVQLSPDGTTYSTLATVTLPVGVALAGTILDVVATVPAGWRLQLTATRATLGTSTLIVA